MKWLKRKQTARSIPVPLPMKPALSDPETFIGQATAYKARLQEASNLDELRVLWSSTAYPYAMTTADPFSDAYRAEVLEIYQRLVDSSYDVQNELTSLHLSEEDFATGYPWSSGNLSIVASELGKAVHGFRVIAEHLPGASSVIEFGAGWGNTAIPLARAGLDVCAVDIDAAFLRRIEAEGRAVGAEIKTMQADFVDAANTVDRRYDVVLFSSSFHHCLEFEALLVSIRENALSENGVICFFAEPVSDGQTFPWGLRYDGEALWAIMCNKWLELGFTEKFFRDLMARTGFALTKVPDAAGLMGPGWIARRA